MFASRKFSWGFSPPVVAALLVGSAVSGWAAAPETPNPCTRQRTSRGLNSHWVDSFGVQPNNVDRNEDRTSNRGTDSGLHLCLGHLGKNLVSDQETIWIRPLHLPALLTQD